jgi:chemotaxis protein CheZ
LVEKVDTLHDVNQDFTPSWLDYITIANELKNMSKSATSNIRDLITADQRISSLKCAHGEMVATRDIVEVVESMISTMRVEVDQATLKIGDELRDMIRFIDAAKTEISSIKPSTLVNFDIPGATDQLDAVVQHTEFAAGQIMDCADELSQMATEVNEASAERLTAIATRIYESSSFQDITGQRVTKVVRVLKVIEERLSILTDMIGGSMIVAEPEVAPPISTAAIDERSLLNGPQLAGNGNNQDDIDALLASFD